MDEDPSKPILDRARDLLLRSDLPAVVAIYAFGSVVEGQARRDSDLDLAVLAAVPLDAAQVFEQARSLSVQLDCDVDLIDLRRAGPVVKKEILAHGTRLFCSEAGAVLGFEATSLSEYVHYRESVAELLQAVQSTGRAYAP